MPTTCPDVGGFAAAAVDRPGGGRTGASAGLAVCAVRGFAGFAVAAMAGGDAVVGAPLPLSKGGADFVVGVSDVDAARGVATTAVGATVVTGCSSTTQGQQIHQTIHHTRAQRNNNIALPA